MSNLETMAREWFRNEVTEYDESKHYFRVGTEQVDRFGLLAAFARYAEQQRRPLPSPPEAVQ